MIKLKDLFNESGILYKAGVKKYGKEGMRKIQQAAGKRKSHAEIGAIKDKFEKDKKESVSANEAPDDKIQVPGIGMYTYDVLEKKVQSMLNDLAKNAKRKIWRKSSRNGIRAFAEMWHALSEYERRR